VTQDKYLKFLSLLQLTAISAELGGSALSAFGGHYVAAFTCFVGAIALSFSFLQQLRMEKRRRLHDKKMADLWKSKGYAAPVI
jgi:hypothetical protein